MSKTILCMSAFILSSTVYADDLRNTTRDGAGYEATLRNVGIPQSAGMVWPTNINPPATRTKTPDTTLRTAAPATQKKGV